jgi:multidrug efflux system membrane fusion protein
MRRGAILSIVLAAGVGLAYLAGGVIPSQKPGGSGTPLAVPVLASTVERADFPIILAGLGTVQAFNSVVVKSRVDGQIIKINFSEGKEVKTGEVLVEIDPVPFEAALAQARANKAKDEAQLGNARLDFDRATRLANTGSGSRQQLDTSRALVAQFEAAVQSDQAMIDMAQNQLGYTQIRSPIDGRVGARLVDIGNVVRATDSGGMVVINQLRPIYVNFALSAGSLPQIRTRSKEGDIKVTVQNADGAQLAAGALAVIDNQINPATGTINYKAVFDNQDETLWPGQFVNVRIEVDIRRDATVVPASVVQQGPDGAYCFVIGPDRTVQKRPIKVGPSNKTSAVIEAGLESGELVVSDGQSRIRAGSHVEVLADSGQSTR